MEKDLEKGSDKVQKICDILRRETLEPAREEADRVLHQAKQKAEQIVHEAHLQAAHHLQEAKNAIEKERHLLSSSLKQAASQSLEELRQQIETELFTKELDRWIKAETSSPQLIAKLMDAIISSVEKEGLSKDFSALIPGAVSAQEVNDLLGHRILQRLKEGGVILGGFSGGFRLKLHDEKMTLDFSDETLVEMLSRYLRKEFRKVLFA